MELGAAIVIISSKKTVLKKPFGHDEEENYFLTRPVSVHNSLGSHVTPESKRQPIRRVNAALDASQ